MPVSIGLTPRERKEKQHKEKLESIRRQVKQGTLVIRKATKAEREQRRVNFTNKKPKRPGT